MKIVKALSLVETVSANYFTYSLQFLPRYEVGSNCFGDCPLADTWEDYARTTNVTAVNECIANMSGDCIFHLWAELVVPAAEGPPTVSLKEVCLQSGDPIVQAWTYAENFTDHGLIFPDSKWELNIEELRFNPRFFFDAVAEDCGPISGYGARPSLDCNNFTNLGGFGSVNAKQGEQFSLNTFPSSIDNLIVFNTPTSCGVPGLTLLNVTFSYYGYFWRFEAPQPPPSIVPWSYFLNTPGWEGCTRCFLPLQTDDVAYVNACIASIALVCPFSVTASWGGPWDLSPFEEVCPTNDTDSMVQTWAIPPYLTDTGLIFPDSGRTSGENVQFDLTIYFDEVAKDCVVSGYLASQPLPLDCERDISLIHLIGDANATQDQPWHMPNYPPGHVDGQGNLIALDRRSSSACGVQRLTMLNVTMSNFRHSFQWSAGGESTEEEGGTGPTVRYRWEYLMGWGGMDCLNCAAPEQPWSDVAFANECIATLSEACSFNILAEFRGPFADDNHLIYATLEEVCPPSKKANDADSVVQAWALPTYLTDPGLIFPDSERRLLWDAIAVYPTIYFDGVKDDCVVSVYWASQPLPVDCSEEIPVSGPIVDANATKGQPWYVLAYDIAEWIQWPANLVVAQWSLSACGVPRLTLLNTTMGYFGRHFAWSPEETTTTVSETTTTSPATTMSKTQTTSTATTPSETEAPTSPAVECECPNEGNCPCPAVNIRLRHKPLHMVFAVDNRVGH